jgi:hypothetical protein
MAYAREAAQLNRRRAARPAAARLRDVEVCGARARHVDSDGAVKRRGRESADLVGHGRREHDRLAGALEEGHDLAEVILKAGVNLHLDALLPIVLQACRCDWEACVTSGDARTADPQARVGCCTNASASHVLAGQRAGV